LKRRPIEEITFRRPYLSAYQAGPREESKEREQMKMTAMTRRGVLAAALAAPAIARARTDFPNRAIRLVIP
jgi:hypothetical protein